MAQSIEEQKYERLSQAIANCKTAESFEKIKSLIEAEPSALKLTNKLGLRPLQETLFCESDEFGVDLCQLFLKHGAAINHKELTGGTVLQLAIAQQKENFVAILIANPQLEVNLKSFYGTSPLMNALKQARKPELSLSNTRYKTALRIIDKLLRAGASTQDMDEKKSSLGEVLLQTPFLNIAPDIQSILTTIEREEIEKLAPLAISLSDSPKLVPNNKIVAKKKQIKI